MTGAGGLSAVAGDTDDPPPDTIGFARLRRALPLVVFGVLVVIGVATSSGSDPGLPLDPDSAGPLGTKALRLILEEVGAEVRILEDLPTEELDTILVLADNFDDAAADDISRHVIAGSVLLVTDPGGALTPRLRPAGSTGSGFGDLPLHRRCGLPALHEAAEVRVGFAPLFRVPDHATGCYREGRLSWLVARPLGSGTVVATGGPGWLTNRGIRAADNAVLAGALLAPRPGTTVGILRPDLGAGGDDAGSESITDLIPRSLRLAFAQLLVAFGLVVLWRWRRLGTPLAEPQPVRLAGSELVLAVGNLLQRTGARRRAAAILRHDLRGVLSRRLSAAADTDASQLADAVAARTGVDRARVVDVLDGQEPQSDTDLVLLAQRAESIRHAVLAPPGSGDDRVDNE